ncbi:Hsp20/alpha crystallin family protein [Actinoplanes subtropicus]|uniref:Hsp20/alpha crystallin family protein n=1 Tax=Actinoplanes subtropicus TaxID=543632 RepID=UPI0004C44289|nr:Hsp20 family protein [Actinoplanes subtropicus]
MLMRSEPFTEVNRLAQQLFGAPATGTWSRPTAMPADAYRDGDEFVIAFDLPGVDADAIDIGVERNVLTVRAERRPIDLREQATMQLSERPRGVFSRQLLLGDALDTDHIDAAYDDGVLVVRIPIAAKAKPRKITVAGRERTQQPVITG